MNPEQNNNINNNNTVSTNQANNSNILAGSPGVVVAPVGSLPVDASSADKGAVNGVSNINTPTVNSNTPTMTSPVMPTTPPIPPVAPATAPVATTPEKPKKKSHKAFVFIFFLLLIIGALSYYIYTDYKKDQAREECSPLVASDNSVRELDINSSIVQELYNKVKTNIREDLAYHNFDDVFKLYLAYRQIPHSDIYDSNCNLFDESVMSNFTCSSVPSFTPNAFKEETLQREVKKLFGESVEIPNQNIVLGNSCFGGYQYIAKRGEYVQGYCGSVPTTSYNVEKKLLSASVQGDTITIRENVRYYSAQGIDNDQLQNGVYVHTFKLDNHYHYAYVNRTIEGA